MSTTTPHIPSLLTAKKLGFIIPSSNTAAETLIIAILQDLKLNVIPLFTRLPVLTLSTHPSSTLQFSPSALHAATTLLAHAAPDAILWAGTSGMFIPNASLQSDLALAESMTQAAGGKIPCSTTTLATLSALKFLGLRDVSIAVPYTLDLTSRVGEFFSREGFEVHAAETMGRIPGTNLDIARCEAEEIREVVRASVVEGKTGAVVVACTNWPAAALVGELERELEVAVVDSISVTLWEGLRMVGIDCSQREGENGKVWGRLFESF